MQPTIRQWNLESATQDRLLKYIDLLGKWRQVTNLISEQSFSDIWERHILDSVHLFQQKPKAKCWLDIGSGAGLPAVIIATLLADVSDAQVHCVEADRRKCSFLREVASQLLIPLKIHNIRAEAIDASSLSKVEVVTARAFSSIERILQIAGPFLSQGAVVVLPRGCNGHDEVAQIDSERYTVETTPNPSPDAGVFVRIQRRALTF